MMTEGSIKELCRITCERDTELKNGARELDTKGTGREIKDMDLEYLLILTNQLTKENFCTTNEMGKGRKFSYQRENLMKECGVMICLMVLAN